MDGEQSASNGANLHALLQPQLFVEVLDSQDRPCPPGVRGEITLSCGFNPFLPLLRYRTGDFASMIFLDAAQRVALAAIEGRPPTVFRGMGGQRINNIDISTVLKPFAFAQYTLHQAADGSLTLRVQSGGANPDAQRLRRALLPLFGDGQELNIAEMEVSGDKVLQYTSDYPD
jgi:phenylacetate-CoA ligase